MSGGRFNLNDYVTVDERIDTFWANHPGDGSIQTEVAWVGDDGASVAIRASVYLGARLVATGIAQEERGAGGANRTSWWENAETSAIGRALANFGMSLSRQRPSREEMRKVERGQDAPVAPPDAPGGAETPREGEYTWAHLKRDLRAFGIGGRGPLEEYLGTDTAGWAPADILTAVKDKAKGATR